MVPDATQVADPFHVVKLANDKLDECRRRVQNETFGHRGRKSDPLYRCRRLLTKADERLDDEGRGKLLGLLRAGDPHGEVATAWHAKEAVRELYGHDDPDLAPTFVDRLAADMDDPVHPVEVRSLGRTLKRWRLQIAAWHRAKVSNGPTEAMNNLIKRVKRGAFGFRDFASYRVRALLYAGRPDWSLLESITPRCGDRSWKAAISSLCSTKETAQLFFGQRHLRRCQTRWTGWPIAECSPRSVSSRPSASAGESQIGQRGALAEVSISMRASPSTSPVLHTWTPGMPSITSSMRIESIATAALLPKRVKDVRGMDSVQRGSVETPRRSEAPSYVCWSVITVGKPASVWFRHKPPWVGLVSTPVGDLLF
jgi:hypothetical protein